MGWDPWSQWCGICEEWGAHQVGGRRGIDFPLLHYTPTAAQGYKDRGRWTLDPVYGAHVFFDWGGAGLGSDTGLIDHIGFCLSDRWDGDYVDTIEGNIMVNGRPSLGVFRRHVSVISGFGLPDYATQSAPTPVPTSEEDPMVILRNPNGWHVVLGDRLIRVGGAADWNMVRADVERNTVRIDVSDAQLKSIQAAFAK
jgi:hypothetical protein